VLKRLIREAAEKGYDKVAWTTGEQQAERYDLSKQVDRVRYKQIPHNGEYELTVIDKGGHELDLPKESFKEGELESVVGKDLAQKIIDGEGKNYRGQKSLSGLDLKVGGEGMKGFYDKILVDFANKFAKKFGGRVEESKIESTHEDDTTLDSYSAVKKGGEWLVRNDRTLEVVETFQNKDDAVERADFLTSDPHNQNVNTVKVHSLEITPCSQRSRSQ
jgi:hypothetical protein